MINVDIMTKRYILDIYPKLKKILAGWHVLLYISSRACFGSFLKNSREAVIQETASILYRVPVKLVTHSSRYGA